MQPYARHPTFHPFLSIRRVLSVNSCLFSQRPSRNARVRVNVRVFRRTTTRHTYTTEGVQSNLRVGCYSLLPSTKGAQLFHTAAVIITDHEYPVRPAFSLLTKLLDDFTAKIPQSSFSNPSAISFPELNTYLQKYQDPRHADNIMRVQQELDETKIVLVRICFSLLIDFLVAHV